MIFNDPRRRRRLTPSVDLLESRRLLSFVVTSYGQDAPQYDLAGPDASQGNSGIVNIHLALSGLSYPDWSYITVQVQGQPGFKWESAPNPNGNAAGDPGGYNSANGYAFAEWIQNPSDKFDGDLFIDPEVRSDLPPPGGSLPLGGSTGTLLTGLTASATLVVTVYYETPGETPDTYTLNGIAGFVSATDPMPPPATPNPVVGFSVTNDYGQDGLGNQNIWEYAGLVHIAITAPSGVTFSSKEFSTGVTQGGLIFQMSDTAGVDWISNKQNNGDFLYASLRTGTNNVVDLFFPPVRDEAPVNGSTTKNMTLQMTLPGSTGTTVYTTSFMGANWDMNKLLASPPSQTDYSVTSIGQLQSDLKNNYSTIGTIDLAPNHTFISYVPLEIYNSVTINGNGDTLEFEQSGAPWPSTATGAIFTYSGGYQNLQITLNNFTIEFANSPIQWTNPSGYATTYYDPLYGTEPQLAVINDSTQNQSYNIDDLSLNQVSILGPPAFDSNSSTENYQYLLAHDPNSGKTYAGEPALPLILAGGFGNITGPGTLAGGSIKLWEGPWLVNDNTDEGARADTFSLAAFEFTYGHDVLLQGNTVTQSASPATLFRLVNFAGYGFNDVVETNSFGGNAGEVGDEDYYDAGSDSFGGLNDPEVMLEEQNGIVFEGRAGAVSSDGLLVVMPEVRDGLNYGVAQDAVVSILSAVNGNGTPDAALAGEWFPVAQVVNISANNSLELLMQTPLPPMPAGGYYVVELAAGYVNTSFINNTINLTSKSSIGFVACGNEYGTRLIGNTFIGGGAFGTNGTTGAAIVVTTYLDTPPTSGAGVAYPLPQGWTAPPTLGILVEDNIIDDSLGGIVVGVNHYINSGSGLITSASLFGRVYVTATIVGNTFEWDTNFLNAWDQVPNNPYQKWGNEVGENPTPPTVTIGSGFSADAPGIIAGPRYPWTVGGALNSSTLYFIDPTENQVDVQGNSTQIINSNQNNSVSPLSGPTGQVYAGYVNGVLRDSTAIPEQLKNPASNYSTNYYPFNMNTGLTPNPDAGLTLDITAAPRGTQGIQALMLGQDGYDLVGSGTGNPPSSDGIQDLHIELIGLSPTSSLSSLVVTDTVDNEQWSPEWSSSSPQIVWRWAAGATTADIFIQPTIAHLNDPFTIQLTYQTGGAITIPVQGVLFNPLLPVFPTVPQAPTDFGVTRTTSSTVSLSWVAPAGATSYNLDREPAGSNNLWSPVSQGQGITTTTFTDTGLSSSTGYSYEIAAVETVKPLGGSPFSQISPFSQALTVTTTNGSIPDILKATSVGLDATENATFNLTVAQFTDTTNSSLPASDCIVAIDWGDHTSNTGSTTGTGGSFSASGSHVDSASGNFNIQVKITMVSPYTGSAGTVSTATVSQPLMEVGLSCYFHQIGITKPGSSVQGQLGASGNESYSSTALGSGPVYWWNSNPYVLGNANVADVVQATGQTIPLSCTNCSSIDILATATGGVNQGGVFKVTYSGGSYDEYTIGLSDWNLGYNGAGTNAPGESTAFTMNDLDTYSGGTNGTESQTGEKTFLYGYVIPTSPSKTITGLVLPSDADIQVLAMDEISQPSQVDLASYFNEVGITKTGSSTPGGFFGSESYSWAALGGNTVAWGTSTFDLGSLNSNNVMSVSGQSIYLTPGSDSSIQILAASANGYNQSSQFTVFYLDGSSSSFTQTFSDWHNGYNGHPGTTAPGESIVATMSSYNMRSGNHAGTTYLYGYSISTVASSTVASITLSYNPNVTILAIDEINQSQQYMVIVKGRGNGPVGGTPGSLGKGSPVFAPEGPQPAAAGIAPSLNDLLSLAIDGVVSSAASLGHEDGLSAGPDEAADPLSSPDQPSGGPSWSPGAVMLGPITAPLAPIADYVRARDHSKTPLF
jgi:Fibronectin type III domain